METLDWGKLLKDTTPDTKKISYEENKHNFTKIAFDVFRLNDSPTESLWILEEGDDGKQYLVATYEDEESNNKRIESKGSWLALADKEHKNITLSYRDIPIQRFASSEYGFTKEDSYIFQKMLLDKLGEDKEFVKRLLDNQSEERKNVLVKQFPELA